ncbi:MAG TPA: adenylate/guanylate cyclase domain-containing protein [Steroidobacteraceae bacterium]|nr:adenylate/guanylate cyclase domain-containing protein [Steroidobacteraceae bacterium]
MDEGANSTSHHAISLSLPEPIPWLLTEARRIADGETFLARLCERLLAVGLPLYRATIGVRVLHPQLIGVNLLWRRGSEVERIERTHGTELTSTYLESPIRVLYEGAAALRRRLEGPDAQLDFPILKELRAEGVTDYVAMAMPDMEGQPASVTWASDRPGGFSTADLTLLWDILPILSLSIEVRKVRRLAGNLLDFYLGQQTGRRVLQGAIRRGELETIHAALWYSDLRGFTAMSDTLPFVELIELLNAYFEAVSEPVMARGGEVLKFIGDAMLAIFALDPAREGEGVRLAMEAAEEALRNVERVNGTRAAQGKRAFRLGIALHVGDVGYGNIGAPTRLDFTVIGQAVNKVVRIEALSKALDRPLLVSSEFAHRCTHPLISLGFHALRGISEPEEIFACPHAEEGVRTAAAKRA